jgi:drug/metabolite transporter (DMT)-like permease
MVGLALALGTAVVSGVSVFINSYAVKEFADPALLPALKNALVGVILLGLVARPSTVREIRHLTGRQATGLSLLGLIGGGIPFVLFFEGLARVNSGNAAFIHKTLFLWVAMLAVVFLKERAGVAQSAALGLILLSTVLVGGPGALELGAGEALVLAATLLWSVEVVLAKRLLAHVTSGLAACARMSIGGVFLLGYTAAQGDLATLGQLTATHWAWVAGTAVLLLAYVTTWYAALKRAPATAVTCVLALGAPMTAWLTVLAGRPALAAEHLTAYVLLLSAVAAYAALAMRAGAARSTTSQVMLGGTP